VKTAPSAARVGAAGLASSGVTPLVPTGRSVGPRAA